MQPDYCNRNGERPHYQFHHHAFRRFPLDLPRAVDRAKRLQISFPASYTVSLGVSGYRFRSVPNAGPVPAPSHGAGIQMDNDCKFRDRRRVACELYSQPAVFLLTAEEQQEPQSPIAYAGCYG